MSPREDAPAGLLGFLGRPELRRLWSEVRDRLESRGGVAGSVSLTEATEEERRGVAGLLGLAKLPRGGMRIPLERLDRALRSSRFGVDLPTAMALLGGPLRDRPGERARTALRWEGVWEEAGTHAAVTTRPELQRWLADLRTTGLLRRLAPPGEEARLLAQALAVLATLGPGREDVRLPVLASAVLGSSHALDAGRPAATLVLRALAVLADRPPPRSAAERRELWEWAGVVADDLSCDVLVLGLAPAGGGLIGEGLRAFAAAGEPVWLTLRQLVRTDDLAFPPGLRVRVCENPVVVAAAAERLGPASPPLVCVAGFPNQAARRLLSLLLRQGAEIAYHGDFDWAGLTIANTLHETVPFAPWRFTAADYRAALAAGGERPALGDWPMAARWDPDLAPAMADAGLAVEEETVLDALLEDLAR